ncbi:Pentatricopeptide repeat-containing protein, mitochondrial [Vitis vinifera]|uniref:Pentatricopeptide repeat-containing protein, mitochondrial n=1 Tax=Vitis vinifera TaxID=29760 RepID=A0A438H189_VITVI|nr:Pentatricopeptide repeat-containing protein, mitochondrial [Vitis vinifera]RVW78366.1 Pentatricopeptide repeat-containing protein, mitochondrial [Vitis vinifera]
MTLSLTIKLAAHLQQRNLLSLLLKDQTRRSAMQQLHPHLITTGAHYHCMDFTSWNTLLRHYSLGTFPQEAFLLFRHLRLHHVSPPLSFNSFSFSFLLKACAYLQHRKGGLQLHALTLKAGFEFHVYLHTVLQNVYAVCGALLEAKQVLDEMPVRNSVTWNVLITGLAKWGELHLARSLFDEMPMPTVVSWTTIIDGYTRMNQPKQALALFRTMFIDEGIKPTEITLLAIFPAISNLGALELCQLRASRVFGEIAAKSRNVVSWTSVISAFAMHGMAEEVLANFERMQKECLKPNRITFLSVLNACSHGGLVEEGLKFFATMGNEYQMSPDVKHYGCLIDMLGRAGRLDEAEKMALEIPDDVVNVVIWRTLLGACSFHGNVEMGARVTRKILEMERKYGGGIMPFCPTSLLVLEGFGMLRG